MALLPSAVRGRLALLTSAIIRGRASVRPRAASVVVSSRLLYAMSFAMLLAGRGRRPHWLRVLLARARGLQDSSRVRAASGSVQ
eukprot:6269967-Prymnesium_polylepis.1